MSRQNRKIDEWWNEHPLLKNFYVPVVLTATFVVSVIEAVTGGGK